MRYETPAPPAELGELDGLAYSLWLPDADPWAGVVILHGAGSCKESHHDYARAARYAKAEGEVTTDIDALRLSKRSSPSAWFTTLRRSVNFAVAATSQIVLSGVVTGMPL